MPFDTDPPGNAATLPARGRTSRGPVLSRRQQADLDRWYRQCRRQARAVAAAKIGKPDADDVVHSAVLRLIEAATRVEDPLPWPATDDEGCATLLTLVKHGTTDTAKHTARRKPSKRYKEPQHSFWQRPRAVLPPKRNIGDRPLRFAFDTLHVDDPPDADDDTRVAFIDRELGLVDDDDARRAAYDARLSTRQLRDVEALEAEDRRRCEILAYRMEALKFLILGQLMKLTQQQHYVIAWHYLRGMKRPVIARLLGIGEKTYDNHRSTALESLRDALRNKHRTQATDDERYWLRRATWMDRRWTRRKEWEARQKDRTRRIRRGEADPWRGKSPEI